LPRQQQSRLAIPCSGSGSRSSGRLRSAKGVARPHGCWRGKGIARPEAAARAEAVVARPGRARLDVGGSSSAADCLRRRSPAAVRANRQGRANVVRRRRRLARTAQPRQPGSSGTSCAFALTGSISEGRERPFSSAPGAMRTRRESLRPVARDHPDSRDRPTEQQGGAVAVATTAAGPDRRTAAHPDQREAGRRQRSVSSCESPLRSLHVHIRRRRRSNGGEQ